MLDLLRGELSAHAAGSDGPGESGDCDPDAQAALLEIKDALIQNIPHEWLRRFDAEGDSSQAFGLDFARICAFAEDYQGEEQAMENCLVGRQSAVGTWAFTVTSL